MDDLDHQLGNSALGLDVEENEHAMHRSIQHSERSLEDVKETMLKGHYSMVRSMDHTRDPRKGNCARG